MLDVTANITLNAGGSAVLFFSPSKYREEWHISRFSTEGNSVLEPNCNIYRGAAGSRLLDTTRRGNSAVSETELVVMAGERITVVYSNGTPGASMQFHIEGEVKFPYGISA